MLWNSLLTIFCLIFGLATAELPADPDGLLASYNDSEDPDASSLDDLDLSSTLTGVRPRLTAPSSSQNDLDAVVKDIVKPTRNAPGALIQDGDFYVDPEFGEIENDSGDVKDAEEEEEEEEEIDDEREGDVLNWVKENVGAGIFEDVDTNNDLLSDLPRDFGLVYPVQLRKNEILSLDTHDHDKPKPGIHFHHTSILFTDYDVKYRLKLTLNKDLISRDLKQKRNIDEKTQIIEEGYVENCFYQGEVKKSPGSKVVVSTCSGISGIIVVDDKVFIIQPLAQVQTGNETDGKSWTRWPHAVYELKDEAPSHRSANHRGLWQSFRKLHVGEFMRRRKIMMAMRNEFDVLKATKRLQLGLVADHSMVSRHNGSVASVHTHLLQMANVMDAILKDVNFRISVKLLEVWNYDNLVTIDTNARTLLHNFLNYRLETMSFVELNVVHLLTAKTLQDQEIGMAIPDSICSDRAVGVSQDVVGSDLLGSANTVLHMIGHILGITEQPEGTCPCPKQGGCLMQLTANGSIPHHALVMSPCAQTTLEEGLLGGLGSCLLDNPPRSQSYGQIRDVFPQSCGNGRLERGEECDCMSVQECRIKDPCCNPRTCLLQPWATCRFGDCCHNCTVLPPTYMCRLSGTECDVPEFCDGAGGFCPSNQIVQTGWPCQEGEGFCYKGLCQTYSNQCQLIWGPQALRGDQKCYETFNTAGRFDGHCGPNKTASEYIKCDNSDVGCGLLHCAGGDKQPRLSTDKTFSTTTVNSGGNNYQCKILSSHHPADFPVLGQVQQGTKCDNNSVCVDSRCVNLATMVTRQCPVGPNALTCSGRGRCTDAVKCFCNSNYTGSDCNVYRKQTTYMPVGVTTSYLVPKQTSTPTKLKVAISTDMITTTTTLEPPIITKAEKAVSTTWLVIVLSSVAGGALVLLGCCMICYRRKSTMTFTKKKKKKKKNPSIFGSITSFSSSNSKGSKSREDSGDDTSNRIISFGNMPSYRADKLKKVMRKSLGGISEQSEESEHSRPGDRDSTEIRVPHTLPLARPPEKGILKKHFPHSSDDLVSSSDERVEMLPLRRLGPVKMCVAPPDVTSSSPRRRPPTPPVCEESGETQAMLAQEEEDCPDQDQDECGSCCSCDKKSDLSFSDPDLCDDCCTDAKDQQTQTDPESGGSPAELSRDVSSDSLEGAKNKIIKLKNINELLKQIDEQFNSVLRQTTQGDMSPSGSDELRGSETEADRHFPRNSFYKQSDIEEGYSPPHRSPVLSPNPSNQRCSNTSSDSPEPLPSPSGIISPIQAQSPASLSSPFPAGVPQSYRDPLRGPRHTTSTPKTAVVAPQDRNPMDDPSPPPPRPPRDPHSPGPGSPSASPRTSPPRTNYGPPSSSTQSSLPRFPALDKGVGRASGSPTCPRRGGPPIRGLTCPDRPSPPNVSSMEQKPHSPKGSPKNLNNHSNNTASGGKVDPPVTAIPYRGAKSSVPSSPTLPRQKSSPTPSGGSTAADRGKGHKASSPKSPGSSFLSKLAHGLDGYPFKRRGSRSNDGNSISEGYGSDREAEDAIIIREIPVKKPVELPFIPNPKGAYTKAPGSPGSPEDINV